MAPPHPLRRISTGSLSSLARSQDRSHTSPSGLDFLQPALIELVDESETLAGNVQKLTRLHDALGTFNESFAGYLYALKMNAFCVEWPLAPDANSFSRMEELEKKPEPIPQLPKSVQTQPQSPPSNPSANSGDLTYATNMTDDIVVPPKRSTAGTAGGAAPKKPVTGVLKKTALAEKKRRELEVAGIIDTLPLEYRGSQPAMRQAMEKVIMKLMDNPDGLPLKFVVSPPQVPQPRANKCLIALVAKKLVTKVNVGGTTWYKWLGA